MGLAQDEAMIQALAAKGADDPLDKRVVPGRVRGDADLADPHPLDSPRELLAVDRVSITKQESRSRIVRERLDDLLGRPDRSGVIRDVDVEEFAPIVAEDDEDEERRKVRVGTTKKSMATMSRACAIRKARQVGEGCGEARRMYLATVSSATA